MKFLKNLWNKLFPPQQQIIKREDNVIDAKSLFMAMRNKGQDL